MWSSRQNRQIQETSKTLVKDAADISLLWPLIHKQKSTHAHTHTHTHTHIYIYIYILTWMFIIVQHIVRSWSANLNEAWRNTFVTNDHRSRFSSFDEAWHMNFIKRLRSWYANLDYALYYIFQQAATQRLFDKFNEIRYVQHEKSLGRLNDEFVPKRLTRSLVLKISENVSQILRNE